MYLVTSDFKCYKDIDYNKEDLKNSKYISERVITLPLYESLGLEEVKYICNILKERI